VSITGGQLDGRVQQIELMLQLTRQRTAAGFLNEGELNLFA
jgi:hypothetical protein